jgi:hypothetical protein
MLAGMKIASLLNRKSVCTVLAVCGLSRLAFAGDPTALELIKAGNDYVGKDSKDKVVQIRSDKSIGTLTPNIWYVVYYDVDARLKATEVKFGAGRKMDVQRPFRLIERIKPDRLLDPKQLHVDSDRAIKIAASEPLLDKLTLRATQLWLDWSESGPVWRVRLWAAKLRHPNEDSDIGEVLISAEDGKVIKTDLHIDRVD